MKNPLKITICIPTYNRVLEIRKNLSLLEKYILDGRLEDKVRILISDNHSPDGAWHVISQFQSKTTIPITSFEQDSNIGGIKNTLFLLEHATTSWVMLLGDDDYLEPWYIGECLKQIEEHPNLGCIIPNYADFYPETKEYGKLREENCETQYYEAGFDACIQNAWRGHQLSGLCFKREGLVEAFRKNKMNNLYPQIFFVAYNALRYDVLHFGQMCLGVSEVLQCQKDWTYGEDGLINDMLENFRYLGLSSLQRAQLEVHIVSSSRRYEWAVQDTNLCIEKILCGSNVSWLGRYYIALHILHVGAYTGKRKRFLFYIIARISLFYKLIFGKPIRL